MYKYKGEAGKDFIMKWPSDEFKMSLIQKNLLPNGPSLRSLAEKNDLSASTLYSWKRKYVKRLGMKTSNEWTPEKKMETIIKTASMEEGELGEFLRQNGLYSTDIAQWKQDFYSSQQLAGRVGRPKKSPELVELEKSHETLKKELRRKEKALAEMSARVVLLKKSQEIFGGREEEE